MQMVVQPLAFDARQTDVCVYGDKTGPLDTYGSSIGVCVTGDRTHAPAIHFDVYNHKTTGDVCGIVREQHGTNMNAVLQPSMSVRRLTPTECERLQGFPDGWTAIPWKGKPASECPDGPRYRALGNSMAVNVMRWIGRRIELVDAL
jgi:DNA (cytosine-5)-methyltransferase 1